MKKLLIILIALVVAALLIKKKNMTWKQSMMKTLYPVIMLAGKLTGKQKNMALNSSKTQPIQSFYELTAIKNNGDTLYFNELKGKIVLIVNTASDCGYTRQFEELEQLYKQYGDHLIILGFPANDFKEQEKKSDSDIAEFCKVNYGITFQLMKKSRVIKNADQNPVFQWLSNPAANGWCNRPPVWNFCKYVVDENGILQAYFTQMISPLSEEVKKAMRH